MTGMFRSTVSDIVKELISSRLLIEKAGKPEGRGRVPVLLSLNDRGFEVVGVSVRPEQTIVGLAGLSGRLGKTIVFPTPTDPSRLMSRLSAAIEKLRVQGEGRRGRTIEQIGVSVPGLVDAGAGRIRWLPHIPGYSDFDLAAAMEKQFGIPTAIDNDANLAALAEFSNGVAGQDPVQDFVFVEIGTEGVGGGVVLKGEIYRGHDKTLAGEFGHMVIEANGLECGCGRKGCWEMYVSDRATLRRSQLHGSTGSENYGGFLEAALDGDRSARACLEETARYIAIGLTNIAFALNPKAIVVAGRICEAWPVVFPIIESAFSTARLSLRVRKAMLGANELFLQGAILLALSRAFSQPVLGINAGDSMGGGGARL
jgi:predicted NBD/HSP70 family sugar kinase